MREKIESLLKKISEAENNPKTENTLPQNAYYLEKDEILCTDRKFGVSRFPYVSDGLILWAYSNGIIEACESTFHIFKPLHYAEEPSVNFFGGIKKTDGKYIPVSLFSNSKQLNDEIDIKRYVVYTNSCVYYIADTSEVTFALRIHADSKKHLHFSFNAFNKTDKKVSIYMFSFFEAILRNCENENFWDRMHKYGKLFDNSSALQSFGDFLLVSRTVSGCKEYSEQRTVGRTDIVGNRKSVLNSQVLKTGEFLRVSDAVNTTNLPVAANIFKTELTENGEIRCEFDLSYYHSGQETMAHIDDKICIDSIDSELKAADIAENAEYDNLSIHFDDWNGNVNAELLNKFLRTVQKQVSTCALGKNYAGSLIGIRDVMQQLDGSLMWQPEKSREKIINTLNYVLEDGRAPRQFSVPANPNTMPKCDLHEYIDQGVWIIATVYEYLAFTGDYSILDEKCSYYVVDEANTKVIAKSDITDTVLDHLVKITDFLLSNIDRDFGTNCLRALVGDWNDAIDALGKTEDKDKKFGSGVSVMATTQFYENLYQMKEILTKTGKYTEKIAEYGKTRQLIEEGLKRYAVDTDCDGNKRIIHGWGDKYSYKIGSFNDPDGNSRISSIANSFWVLSGMIKTDTALKNTIIDDINKLDSKYGLITFDKAFTPDMAKYVGRISGIMKGTYENNAAYVHASLFAGCALFLLGESETAWKQLEKSITISHENCTMTSFVMPNSYCENPDFCIDGVSMGDWYTGSGTVLIKEIIRYGFGISPTLDGLYISVPKAMNFCNAQVGLKIKGKRLKLNYNKNGGTERGYYINGNQLKGEYDSLSDTTRVFIPNEELYDGITVDVVG